MSNQKIIRKMTEAISAQDADQVEDALLEIYGCNELEPFVPVLIEVLKMESHFLHEDIVGLFQKAKDPRANQILYKTAFKRFPYLDFDDAFGLARKCTWALADIGTEESKNLLRQLSNSDNPIIVGYAKRRLDRWEQEQSRKSTASFLD